MSDMKMFAFSYMGLALVFLLLGFFDRGPLSQETMITTGIALLAVAITYAVQEWSSKDSEKATSNILNELSEIKTEVTKVQNHLAIPENIAEAQKLANRIQNLEWKVDEVRKSRRFSLFGDRYYARGEWSRKD